MVSCTGISRFFRHFFSGPWLVRRFFPPEARRAIERAIAQAEAETRGEIRFAVEYAIHPLRLLSGVTARERAVEVFSELQVWDTEENSGVLVYLLLADRDFEIVADRGIDRLVAQGAWNKISQDMERLFTQGKFLDGVLLGIEEIAALLKEHLPSPGSSGDELPNRVEEV